MQRADFKDTKSEGLSLLQLSRGGKKPSQLLHTAALGVCLWYDTEITLKEERKSVQKSGESLHEKARKAWNSKIMFANDSSEN